MARPNPTYLEPLTTADTAAAWDALALELRQLVELAEQTRDTLVNVADPSNPQTLTDLRIAHERMDESARAVLPLVGECRRTTYRVLRAHLKIMEVVQAFGLGSYQAVANVLAGRRSASKRKRKVEGEEEGPASSSRA